MATTHCPACGLTVPYFCCEGLVCPACGFDEERNVVPEHGGAEGMAPQTTSGPSLPTDPGASQPPVQ